MVWIFGSFLSWRMTAFLMMVPALSLILLLSKLPETPYWLIQDGQLGMARRSLQYFRGKRAYRLPIFTTKYYESTAKILYSGFYYYGL